MCRIGTSGFHFVLFSFYYLYAAIGNSLSKDEPERDGVDVEGEGTGGQGHQHSHELHGDRGKGRKIFLQFAP